MANEDISEAPLEAENPARRIEWIDWARALGACSIVFLHVLVSTRIELGEEILGTSCWVMYAMLEIALCRWAVPSFMMISGMLLLDDCHTFGWEKAWGHAKRMIGVILTFGLVFAAMEASWQSLSDGIMPSPVAVIWQSVASVATARTWDHLWYVYAMVPAYLAIPVLRETKEHIGSIGFSVLTWAMLIVFVIFPFAISVRGIWTGAYISPYSISWLPLLASNFLLAVSCMCLGDWVRDRMGKWTIGAGIIAVVAMSASWMALRLTGYEWCSEVVSLHKSPLVITYATGILSILRLVSTRMAGGTKSNAKSRCGRFEILTNLLARNSFGIYVLHPLLIHLAIILLPVRAIYMPVAWELSLFIVSVAVSCWMTSALRKVPLFGGLL